MRTDSKIISYFSAAAMLFAAVAAPQKAGAEDAKTLTMQPQIGATLRDFRGPDGRGDPALIADSKACFIEQVLNGKVLENHSIDLKGQFGGIQSLGYPYVMSVLITYGATPISRQNEIDIDILNNELGYVFHFTERNKPVGRANGFIERETIISVRHDGSPNLLRYSVADVPDSGEPVDLGDARLDMKDGVYSNFRQSGTEVMSREALIARVEALKGPMSCLLKPLM
jgi:hypothetical protein